MPSYAEGMIVDRSRVICPDSRVRRWYPSSREPFGYERTLGLEYGRVKLSGGISVPGWRKDSDNRFILHKGKVQDKFFDVRHIDLWHDSQKSEDQLQVIARRRQEQEREITSYEAIKPIDKNNTLPSPDYSFRDKDPLPLPY